MWDHGLVRLAEMEPGLLRVSLFLLAGVTLGLAVALRRAAGNPRASRSALALALSILLGAGLFAYFAPGDVAGGDAHAHVARTWLYGDAFSNEKTFPIWTNRWYLGYPLGLHYGVLYFASSGLWSALLPIDVFTTTKLFLWFTHLLSGLLVFFYARAVSRSGVAGIVAAVVYSFSFLHLGPLLLSGQHPLSLVYLLLPAVLLVFEYWDRGRLSHRTAAVLTGTGLALSLTNHLQYGLYTLATFTLYLAARIGWSWVVGHDRRVHVRGRVLFGLSAAATTALLSAWFVIPALLEGKELVLSASDPVGELLGEFSVSGLRNAADLFLWSRIMRDWSYYYVGLVPVGLALVSLLRLGRNSGGELMALWVSGLCLLGLALLNPRFSPFWFFFVALLAGWGATAALELVRSRAWLARSLPYLIALALMADLGPSLIQSPYREVDDTGIGALQERLTQRGDVGRILELTPGKSTLWSSLDVVGTGASTPFGGIPQAATKVLPYSAAIAGAAVSELIDDRGELSRATRDALRLLHVDYLLIPEAAEVDTGTESGPEPDSVAGIEGALAESAEALGSSARIVDLKGYPVWFAPRVERATEVDPLEAMDWYSMKERFHRRELDTNRIAEIVRLSGVDPTRPLLERIFLHHEWAEPDHLPETASSAGAAPSGGEEPPAQPTEAVAAFEILGQTETSRSVRVRYRSAIPGYLLLSYAHSPRIEATVDGVRVETSRSSFFLTVLPAQAGEHEVELRAGISPLRQGLLAAAALGLLSLAFICFVPWVRHSGGRS